MSNLLPKTKVKEETHRLRKELHIIIPYGILDNVPWSGNQGSPSLYKEVVERIRPKVHCFGHIHEGYGFKLMDDIKFVNASCLDGDYMAVNDPVIVEI